MRRDKITRKKKSKKGLIFIVVFLVIIILAGIILAKKYMQDSEISALVSNFTNIGKELTENNPEKVKEPEKTVEIFKGNDRPIAVMIDNHKDAWPQAAINEAYMVYEIIVEGKETRLMALFKGKDIEQIGPVRSARHYFLDYAMENDAIYTHLGWSPQAKNDISKYGIHNINGIYYDTGKAKTNGATFWRSKEKSAPHNAVTSTAGILEIANEKGYRTTSNDESVLNYVTDEVTLENGIDADSIVIPYSSTNKVAYEYDEESKSYIRYARGKLQLDWNTGSDIRAKNIIITFAENYTLTDSENKGRQGLKNIGELDGYYITNGKAIEIVCIKNDREEKTIYQDKDGNEIKVNDGNTFVQICPIDADVVIKANEENADEE